jgi:hypothetical protein
LNNQKKILYKLAKSKNVWERIVTITELTAESLTLQGDTIDNVPIDPPFESKDFADRIEFNSPVYGHQTLKLKK